MVIKNIFAPGLTVGSAVLPYDPKKSYAYVEDPVEGWRVYLRSAAFIHLAGLPFRADKFLVVKRTGASPTGKSWEPPKGQMEGKDLAADKTIMQLLEENVRREVEEEAKIADMVNLRHTGHIYQATEPDFPPNTYFQYHIFQAFVEPATLHAAIEQFAWYKEHPKAWSRLRRDKKEKDAVGWYKKERTGLSGRWAPGLVQLYLR